MVCWLTEASHAAPRAKLAIKHTTRYGSRRWSRTCTTGSTSTRCTATRRADALALNEIGRVTLRTTQPLFFDEYRRNRDTGSFILIDEATNNDRRRRDDPRRAAREVSTADPDGSSEQSPDVVWHHGRGGRGDPADGDRRAGCGRLAHRAVGIGQVDGGGRGRAVARRIAVVPPTCSTATTCATGSTATSASCRSDRTENVRRVGEVAAAVRRRRGGRARAAHLALPRRPRPAPVDVPTGRCAVHRGARRHPARGVRAARPEGPLRQGPGRGADGHDGHRRPLRAPTGSGARALRWGRGSGGDGGPDHRHAGGSERLRSWESSAPRDRSGDLGGQDAFGGLILTGGVVSASP